MRYTTSEPRVAVFEVVTQGSKRQLARRLSGNCPPCEKLALQLEKGAVTSAGTARSPGGGKGGLEVCNSNASKSLVIEKAGHQAYWAHRIENRPATFEFFDPRGAPKRFR